jgi:PAS domain S-box-containing protein
MNDLASPDANIQTALLEAISEAMAGAVLIYDKNDLIVFASPQLLGLLPVSRKYLEPGTRLRDFLGAVYDGGGRFSSDTHASRRAMSREDWVAEQIATLWKERAELVERRGSDRWISFSKRRLPSGYGVCVAKDISEHKKREEQWRIDQERVQITEEVLDNLPFPLTVKDRTLRYVAVNKSMCDFLECPSDDILGKTVQEVHPEALAGRLDPINRHVFETGMPSTTLERVLHPNGAETTIVARKFRIGKPGRYYVVTAMENITDYIRIDPETRQVIPALVGMELDSVKLARRGDRLGQAESIALAEAAGRRVLLVTGAVERETVAIETLEKLGLEASSVSTSEELELFLDLAREAEVGVDLILVDPEMDVRCLELAEQYDVPVQVIDDLDPARDLTGMVLRKLCDRNIPAAAIDWQDCPSPVADSGIDVLVAEDNPVNQIVFSQILESLGYRYLLAADGQTAVELWQKHNPRVVLMDITLPTLNGFEAACEIRRREGGFPATPIIGVLPQAFDRDREACLASGMNDVLLKPISPEALEAIFETHLGSDVPRLARGF